MVKPCTVETSRTQKKAILTCFPPSNREPFRIWITRAENNLFFTPSSDFPFFLPFPPPSPEKKPSNEPPQAAVCWLSLFLVVFVENPLWIFFFRRLADGWLSLTHAGSILTDPLCTSSSHNYHHPERSPARENGGANTNTTTHEFPVLRCEKVRKFSLSFATYGRIGRNLTNYTEITTFSSEGALLAGVPRR